ncbi:hypothetical protein [Pseudosporangium ferrugineum]|uniref:Peptidase inhibitor family I36 n=1 Tax=Pseudosporangium ferrugineum TaxID=439699 RepID=A0A2T0RC27_9ACTN|nr:hypothetical protein [Pseudosporangium ferrugineum]PRY18680.1 hypothetical protein CLV70_14612 [Pseudosporangium ferrugineum]
MRRILTGLLAAVLGLTVGLFAAQPASANGAGHSCADTDGTGVRICLYNFPEYIAGLGYWQRSHAQIGGTCQNLSQHTFTTGGTVNNATSSYIISAGNLPPFSYWRVRFYDWVNCASAGGYVDKYVTSNGGNYMYSSDLGPESDWIGSVQIFVGG